MDLAKFDIALDENRLISPGMQKLAFTPALLNNGEKIPYGLGWFIGKYKKHRIVFHTGWQPSSFSALYVKVPNKNMTLILLANSEDLIAPFMHDLGTGKIESSPYATSFFQIFIGS